MYNDMTAGDLIVSGTACEGLSHVAHWLWPVPNGSSGFKVGLRLLAQDPFHWLQGQPWLVPGRMHEQAQSDQFPQGQHLLNVTPPDTTRNLWYSQLFSVGLSVPNVCRMTLTNEIKECVMWARQSTSLPDLCQRHLPWQCWTTGNRQSAQQRRSPEL